MTQKCFLAGIMNDASKVLAPVHIFNCHVINSVLKRCCAKKTFEIHFSGTEETFFSPCSVNVCFILHVPLPALASACCVPALPFGMSNMPPPPPESFEMKIPATVVMLFEETVCFCQCPSMCLIVQSRSEFRSPC